MQHDVKAFSRLLIRAMDGRTQNEFSRDSRVSVSYISHLIKGNRKSPPSPKILYKIASAARNGVTYADLMQVAGHLESNTADSEISETASYSILPFFEEEVVEWIKDPNNVDYIRLIYKASKNGVLKKLQGKIYLMIDLDK